MKKKPKLGSKAYSHFTWVGPYKVKDSSGFAMQTADGHVELSQEDLIGYERRAARVVLQEAPSIDGAVLKFARKALGLRQAELARLLGYGDTYVSKWENDQEAIHRTVQLALAELLCRVETEGEAVLEIWLRAKPEKPGSRAKTQVLQVRRLLKAG